VLCCLNGSTVFSKYELHVAVAVLWFCLNSWSRIRSFKCGAATVITLSTLLRAAFVRCFRPAGTWTTSTTDRTGTSTTTANRSVCCDSILLSSVVCKRFRLRASKHDHKAIVFDNQTNISRMIYSDTQLYNLYRTNVHYRKRRELPVAILSILITLSVFSFFLSWKL